MDTVTGPWEALHWSAARLGVAAGLVPVLADVLAPDTNTFGFEVHHDGSGRVDLSVFAEVGPGRRLQIPGLSRFELGQIDVAEYDVDGASMRLAGVFHPVIDAAVPGWPQPLLVAPLTGREGQFRMIFPVPDDETFDAAARRVALPEVARRFITGTATLRLGLDFAAHRLGPRVGLEVFLDPAVFDVKAVLSDLGVSPASVALMQEVADALPASRSMRCAGEGEEAIWNEGMAFTHFSISWAAPGVAPVLKSYVMVRCGPQQSRTQLRDASVRAHGLDWTAQVRWASRQPPLRTVETVPEWEAAVDPHSDGSFDRRLQRDGLTRATAGAALLAPHPLQDPPWWEAYQQFVTAVEQPVDVPAQAWTVPFGPLLWPAVAVIGGDFPAPLRWDLLLRLSRIMAPSLLEVSWNERPFGARMAAQIAPEDAQQPRLQFERFCAKHAADGLAQVLGDYPVLGMQVAVGIDQWRAASQEMLDRISVDRQALAVGFGIQADASLDDVSLTGGDHHNGGRSVRILRFGSTQIVYKPRSVRLEGLYSQVAAALRARGVDIAAPSVVDRGDYGYVEYVHGSPASDYAAFYRNAGGLLALLHALGGTDCHQENLIARDDQLILIDAETLITGSPTPASEMSNPQVGEPDTEDTSVLRVGMLPGWLWLDGRRKAVDISALGVAAGGGQQTGIGWRAVNTDAMLRGRVSMRVGHPQSLPTPSGVSAPLADHVEDLVAGFADAYRVLAAGKDSWLREALEALGQAANRVVLRPTYVYASLLTDMAEPAATRSWQQRAWILEKLTRAYLDDTVIQQWPLVAAEQQALQRGDVPYFQRSLRAGDTTWCDGVLSGWPGGDELAAVLEHVAHMGEADLVVQVALIRATVAAAGFRMSRQIPSLSRPGAVRPVCEVAAQCFERSTRGPMLWVGPTLLPDGERATVRAVGSGLYDGRLGFAVACSLAGRPYSEQALTPVLALARNPQTLSRLVQTDGLGLAGLGGLLRGLDVLGHGAVIDAALRAVITPDRVAADTRRDLVLGSAGLIGPLIHREGFEEVIAAAARSLVNAQDASTGAWTTLPGTAALTGMAHGAAGIAVALAQAGVALGDQEFIDAAVRGLDYEAGVYDTEQGNWPDFRETAAGGFMMGWCAGAPGIALSRKVLLTLLPDHPRADRWHEQCHRGLDATAAAPLLARDHLCCGNAARLVILRALGRKAEADAVAAKIASRAGLPVPMIPLDDPTLPMRGLFTGLPGIGLALSGDVEWVWQVLV
jgi:type 2 lantibiotic biosynthesis protein LanM